MGGVTAQAPPAVDVRRIGIVGIGLIGGSLGLALRRRLPAVELVGVDRGEAREKAAAMGAFDRVEGDLEALRGTDLIVLAAPVRQNLAILGRLASILAGATLITDTGSTKRSILQSAESLPPHLSFVGGHPLAGAARGGVEAAREDLFDGRPWLLTSGHATREPADVSRISALVQALGADARIVDAEAHDRLVAFLSHLPQLTASALMHVVGEGVRRDGLALAGPGLVDTTRLAASSAVIWRDICATNADAIVPALDALIESLRRLRNDLTTGSAIDEVFGQASRWREILEASAYNPEP
jgi:prephenate dehydrogenase